MNSKFTDTTRILLLLALLLLLPACGTDKGKPGNRELTAAVTEPKPDNLNITLLLDLSDRISAAKNPGQAARDTSAIMEVVKTLKKYVASKGTFYSKDRIKVVFYPNSYNNTIQNIAAALNIDFGELSPEQKRKRYESIDSLYAVNLASLYDIASNAQTFNGSDLFNYFKHRAEEDCISNDPAFINLLVIISDGYMYYKNSLYSTGNRFSYIAPEASHVKMFRKDYYWQNSFDEGDYGFINAGCDLKKLKILALEFAPWGNNVIDFDIMTRYWGKWFGEMNIKPGNFKILKTDMPALNKPVISGFIKTERRWD